MSRDIKDFIAGFTSGAGVGLGIRQQNMRENLANQKEGEPNSPELQEFDRANGTGNKRRGLFGRMKGVITDNWGSAPAAPTVTMAAPTESAVPWGQGDTAYYEDGGLVTRNAQRRWVQDATTGKMVPVAPSNETGDTPGPQDAPITVPELPPRDWRQDPVYSAPLETVPENKIVGREGAVPLNTEVTPSGNSPTNTEVVAETAVPTGAAPGGKPVGRTTTARKPLRDQTRTEAFDPELDKNDPDNVVGKMLDGGMQFASDAFHLKGDGVAVGTDPNKQKGQRAFLQGIGAADPEDVKALNQIALKQNPNLDKAALSMKRMEIIYRHYVTTGQTDKANKVAFELLQYGAGEAARMGGQAMQQFKAGDHKGALNTLVQAADDIPDGNSAKLTPDGKAVVFTNSKGQQVNSIPITPENIFNYALGLSNKSMYWQVIAQRAALTNPALQKDTAREGKSALDAARIKLIEARTAKLQGGGKGGGGSAGLPAELRNALTSIEGVPTSEVTPGGASIPEQGGGEPPIASGDDDEEDMGDIEQGGGDVPNGQPNATRNVMTEGPLTANRPTKSGLPAYDEPHPLEKWKGKNPYSEVLSNPKFTGYFATKEGRAARSVIEARAREKNKEVVEYNKNKREFERNARKEIAQAAKDDLIEYKGIHNQKDKSKEAGELFENIKSQFPDVQTEYKGADPSVFNTNIVKPTKIVDTAQSIATSNPNMPPNKALRIVGALTRAGTEEGEEGLTSFITHGTDRLGNYVISPKSNPQQRIVLRPDAFNDIEQMRLSLHKKLVADKKKPGFFKQVGDAITSPPRGEPLPRPVKAKPRVIGEDTTPVETIVPSTDRAVNLRIR